MLSIFIILVQSTSIFIIVSNQQRGKALISTLCKERTKIETSICPGRRVTAVAAELLSA
jgi:hypothetical protein